MKKILIVCLVGIFLAACGTGNTNTTYNRSQIGRTGLTSTGVILTAEVVTTEKEGTGLGLLSGGAAGAVAGSALGGGKGSVLMAIGGGVAGAIAGSLAEKSLTTDTALEFLIKEDKTGDIIAIVQSNELGLQPGDHVIMIELDGVKRIRQKMPNY